MPSRTGNPVCACRPPAGRHSSPSWGSRTCSVRAGRSPRAAGRAASASPPPSAPRSRTSAPSAAPEGSCSSPCTPPCGRGPSALRRQTPVHPAAALSSDPTGHYTLPPPSRQNPVHPPPPRRQTPVHPAAATSSDPTGHYTPPPTCRGVHRL